MMRKMMSDVDTPSVRCVSLNLPNFFTCSAAPDSCTGVLEMQQKCDCDSEHLQSRRHRLPDRLHRYREVHHA